MRGLNNTYLLEWDGWIKSNETWTYVSATSFTVSGDQTGKYGIGDPLKWTQNGTTRYSNIVETPTYSSGTGLTTITKHDGYVSTSGDCDILDTSSYAITNNYYGKAPNPQGFPGEFSWVPTLYGSTTAGTFGYAKRIGKLHIQGKRAYIDCYIRTNAVTSAAAGQAYVSSPLTNNTNTNIVANVGLVSRLECNGTFPMAWFPSTTNYVAIWGFNNNGANGTSDASTLTNNTYVMYAVNYPL